MKIKNRTLIGLGVAAVVIFLYRRNARAKVAKGQVAGGEVTPGEGDNRDILAGPSTTIGEDLKEPVVETGPAIRRPQPGSSPVVTSSIPATRLDLIAKLQEEYDKIMRLSSPLMRSFITQGFKSSRLDPNGLKLINGKVIDARIY